MRITTILGAAALSLTATSAANAAVTLDAADINMPITINFTGLAGDPPVVVPELTASLELTLTSISGNEWNFDYAIHNTSTITARLSGFGFDTNPDLSAASATGTFDMGIANPNGVVPVGFGSVDFCVKDGGGPNNCAGGGSGGIFDGVSGSGTLTLGLTSPSSSLTLDRFFVRYQSIDTQYVPSGSGIGVETAVPEPGTWLMMILGFAAIGGAMRRRKQTVQVTYA